MNPEMILEHSLRTLGALAPWPVMTSFLKENGLPIPRGWEELQLRLKEKLNFDNSSRIDQKVYDFLVNYHLHGEKRVSFYKLADQATIPPLLKGAVKVECEGAAETPAPIAVDGGVHGALQSAVEESFGQFEADQCDAASAYPFKLKDDMLGDGDSGVVLVHTRISDDHIDMVFSTTLLGEVRQSITPGSSDEVPSHWSRYEEIVLVRRRPTQVFPVVTYDRRTKTIQVKVPLVGSYAAEDVIRVNVVKALNRLLRLSLKGAITLGFTYNLYKAIRSIYLDSTVGRVVELGFNTDTGSAKLEKMKSEDLRKEIWHDAGKTALAAQSGSALPFVPFRLVVRWDEGGDVIELALPGTTRTISNSKPPEGPTLQHAKVSGTVTRKQFDDRLHILLHHAA